MEKTGKRLKALREKSGLRQEQIADFLGVTQTYISKVESGERNLPVEHLEKLANLYGYDLPDVLDEKAQPIRFAFRAQNASQADLNAVTEISRIALNSRDMAEWLDQPNLPTAIGLKPEAEPDRMELNARALDLRHELGEDASSPVDLFALTEQIEGLTIVFYPMGEALSGLCFRHTKTRLIAVNSDMSYGRQRFTMAHELYHLCYDRQEGLRVCSKTPDQKNSVEKQADQFASYFLVPYHALRRIVERKCPSGSLTLSDIIWLEQYFQISHQAMLWRLISERYLSREDADGFSRNVIQTARMLGYDDRLYRPAPKEQKARTFGSYLKQVRDLQEKDLVSNGKVEELLLDAHRDDLVYGESEEEGSAIVD